jgi:hypothetical protein
MDISSKSQSTRQWALMGFSQTFGIFPIFALRDTQWAMLGRLSLP